MLASVVTRASEPGSKQGISRDWVTLLLKATYLSSVPSKMGNLKLLWGAGTLVAVAAAGAGAAEAEAARVSTTMREMSVAVSAGGGATVASEMEGRGRPPDDDVGLVLEDTVVPATDGVEEVPPVP